VSGHHVHSNPKHGHNGHTGHHHAHFHPAELAHANQRSLKLVLAITFLFFLFELVGGLLANSLALISDSLHMLSDLGSLALTLLAMWIARRPAPPAKTFGYRRVEILAALANGLTLLLVVAFILREAWERFLTPSPVQGSMMLVIATLGLVANLAGVFLLARSNPHANLNVRSAYLHVLGDLLGSVGAVVAGAVILVTGWYALDPLLSAVIAAIVLVGALRLLREVANVLLEASPRELNLTDLNRALTETGGVKAVHDLHVWTITSGVHSLTAHLVVDDSRLASQILSDVVRTSQDRFGIDHVTVQLEREEYDCPGCAAAAATQTQQNGAPRQTPRDNMPSGKMPPHP